MYLDIDELSADCPDLFSMSDEGRLRCLFTINVFQFAQFLFDVCQQCKKTRYVCVIKAHLVQV